MLTVSRSDGMQNIKNANVIWIKILLFLFYEREHIYCPSEKD